MDTHHIRLCHLIWYGGFSRDGHPIDEPVVHAVRSFSVMDVAELVVHGQIQNATTNVVVVSAAIPPSKEIFPTVHQIAKVEHTNRSAPTRQEEREYFHEKIQGWAARGKEAL